MHYVWGVAKREANIEKHQIDFADVPPMFDGVIVQWTRLPQDYSELRIMAVGMLKDIELTVVYVQVDATTRRIVSVRRASRKERRYYAQVTT